MSGLALGLGPIVGGALADSLGWRAIFWVKVPIVAAALVCTALFVPESRAARAAALFAKVDHGAGTGRPVRART